jgi:hypothetical protein
MLMLMLLGSVNVLLLLLLHYFHVQHYLYQQMWHFHTGAPLVAVALHHHS